MPVVEDALARIDGAAEKPIGEIRRCLPGKLLLEELPHQITQVLIVIAMSIGQFLVGLCG